MGRRRWVQIFILEFVRNTGVIYKKVAPVLSAWPVDQSAWRYLKLNTKRWTLARPFRIKFEDESRYISPFPFSFFFYSGSILLVENFLQKENFHTG